jgi:predicted ester cyclase
LGGKGVEGFQKSVLELAKAFPDAHWKAEEILADGNKVVVKQKFTGTQTNQFQNFKPTNKNVSVDGITTFELQNGKIIHNQALTDRLGFLQQLGVLPGDLSTLTNKN